MRIAVTGGGTGGHVFPALAVGEELARRGHEVFYVGSEGLESRVVPGRLPFYAISAGKIDRTALRPGEALKTARGLAQAFALARKLRPQAVFATGGYAAFPFALAARALGAKLFLHEQNAAFGLANRMLAPLAKEIFLALPGPGLKGVAAGMPIEERRYPKEEARSRLGLDPERPTLLVMGGSQGARVFNERLPELLSPFLDRIQVLHLAGPGRAGEVEGGLPHYRVQEFAEGPLAWSAADLAIARAGAMTLAEAAFHRVPLVLVPYPYAAGDHQRKNARRYADAGAALVVEEAEIEAAPTAVASLLNPDKRREMQKALAAFDPSGSAAKIADRLEAEP